MFWPVGLEIRLVERSDHSKIHSVLDQEVQSSLYGVPKAILLETLADHLNRQAAVQFVALVNGEYAGHLLGGVTLRGMIHHLYVMPKQRQRGIGTALVNRYLQALAIDANVYRTNLVYPAGSPMESVFKNVGHTLPDGERLMWTDLQIADFPTPSKSLPQGYEVRPWTIEEDVFSFWNGGAQDLVARSVFKWEEAYKERMVAGGASTLITFEGKIVGALCTMISWHIAGIYHLKVCEEHRHSGIWQNMLHQTLRRLRDLGVYRVANMALVSSSYVLAVKLLTPGRSPRPISMRLGLRFRNPRKVLSSVQPIS